MKKLSFLPVLMLISSILSAQLTPASACGAFTIDIIDGKVSGFKPNAPYAEIKNKFPCFTSTDAEGGNGKCGATIFYADRGIYFYTDRDYIEVKEKYQGKFSTPVMGLSRNALFGTLGNPILKDPDWDAFSTSYGMLVLHYNKAGKVNLIQMTTQSAENLNICK